MSVDIRLRQVRTAVTGHVFLVYWSGTPDAVSVRAVVSELASTRNVVGKALLFCAYVPEWVYPPPADVRRLVLDLTPKMLESCESIHTVHEGEGILPTAFRTVARAMVLAGGYGGKVFVHASLDDFLVIKRADLGAPASAVLHQVEQMRGPGSRFAG